jgi:hypothetical protein
LNVWELTGWVKIQETFSYLRFRISKGDAYIRLRQDEGDGYEENPKHSAEGDGVGELAQVEWSTDELVSVNHTEKDWNTFAFPVKLDNDIPTSACAYRMRCKALSWQWK